jgi:hypothetical protein
MRYKLIPLLLAVASLAAPVHANVFKDIKKALSATSTTEWLDRMYAVAQLEDATKDASTLDQTVRNIDKQALSKRKEIKERLLRQINKMDTYIRNVQDAPSILKKTADLKSTLELELKHFTETRDGVAQKKTVNGVIGYLGNLYVWATNQQGIAKSLVDAVNSESATDISKNLLEAERKVQELQTKISGLDQQMASLNALLTPEAKQKVASYTSTLKTLTNALANNERELSQEIKRELSTHSQTADTIITKLDSNMKIADCSYIKMDKGKLKPENFAKCRAEFFKNAKKKATMGACAKLTVTSTAAEIKACRDDYRHSKDG